MRVCSGGKPPEDVGDHDRIAIEAVYDSLTARHVSVGSTLRQLRTSSARSLPPRTLREIAEHQRPDRDAHESAHLDADLRKIRRSWRFFPSSSTTSNHAPLREPVRNSEIALTSSRSPVACSTTPAATRSITESKPRHVPARDTPCRRATRDRAAAPTSANRSSAAAIPRSPCRDVRPARRTAATRRVNIRRSSLDPADRPPSSRGRAACSASDRRAATRATGVAVDLDDVALRPHAKRRVAHDRAVDAHLARLDEPLALRSRAEPQLRQRARNAHRAALSGGAAVRLRVGRSGGVICRVASSTAR